MHYPSQGNQRTSSTCGRFVAVVFNAWPTEPADCITISVMEITQLFPLWFFFYGAAGISPIARTTATDTFVSGARDGCKRINVWVGIHRHRWVGSVAFVSQLSGLILCCEMRRVGRSHSLVLAVMCPMSKLSIPYIHVHALQGSQLAVLWRVT